MTVGKDIANANAAVSPEQAALVIYRHLFETGPSRMASADRYVAIRIIEGGLHEFKRQVLIAQAGETSKWKSAYTDVKRQLDELRMRLAILEKEGKL